MKKNTIIENIKVEKLVFGGKGFAKFNSENPDLNGKTVFIEGGAIPGAIVDVRVVKSRRDYINTKIIKTVVKSPLEQENPDNLYGNQPGIPWVNIGYKDQLDIKEGQIRESIFHLNKLQDDIKISPIIPSPIINNYRNKIEFSFGKYISKKEEINEDFNLGFHKSGEFDKIIDYNGTLLVSDIVNRLFREIKNFTKSSELPAYDQFNNDGFYRHIVFREAFYTSEMMIILSVNHSYSIDGKKIDLNFLRDFLKKLGDNNEIIKSIYLSLNDGVADVAIGDLELIYGKKYIVESLCGLDFNISPKSFFQTNSIGAEKLYSEILDQVDKDILKDFNILDLYAGTGTIGMIFARYVNSVISVELVSQASRDGEENAKKNNIKNISFVNAKVEDYLEKHLSKKEKVDILIIDPPRAGMHPRALNDIIKFDSRYIIYVSCNPSTLSRDLEFILKNSNYKIENIIPMDMFPHTYHIETIVKLEKK